MARRPRNRRKRKPRAAPNLESRGRAAKVRRRNGADCITRNPKPVTN